MSGNGIIKGLFFDLDGTLCDTDSANYEAYAKAFRDEGFGFPGFIEFRDRTNGLRADKFIPILEPGASTGQISNIRTKKKHYYPQMMHMVKPNAELVAFLRVMAPHHQVVLVTTAQQASAEHVLEAAGISELFTHKIYGADVSEPKPHPEAYLKALEMTGLLAEDVIAFEDSEAGMLSAASAGIKVIQVRLNK